MIYYALSNDDVFNLDQGYDEAGRPYLNLIVAGYLGMNDDILYISQYCCNNI